MLANNKEKLTILAELLLEKEVIFKDDLEKVFGKRPFDEVAAKVEEVIEEVIEEQEKISEVTKDTEK